MRLGHSQATFADIVKVRAGCACQGSVYLVSLVDESYMAGCTQADYVAGKPPPEPPQSREIPPQYFSLTSSGLTQEIAARANTCDIDFVVGDYFEDPVLIIKSAWGGRSLSHHGGPSSQSQQSFSLVL